MNPGHNDMVCTVFFHQKFFQFYVRGTKALFVIIWGFGGVHEHYLGLRNLHCKRGEIIHCKRNSYLKLSYKISFNAFSMNAFENYSLMF